MSLSAGVGIADEWNAVRATDAAVRDALSELGPVRPDLVLLFAHTSFDPRAVAKAAERATGLAPILGATSAGEFASKKERARPSVVALALGGTKKGGTGTGDGRDWGEALQGALATTPRASVRSLLFAEETLRATVATPLPFPHEDCATIGMRASTTHSGSGGIFAHADVYRDTVAIGALGGMRATVARAGGWIPVGRPEPITRSEDAVTTIGGLSADAWIRTTFGAHATTEEDIARIIWEHPVRITHKDGTFSTAMITHFHPTLGIKIDPFPAADAMISFLAARAVDLTRAVRAATKDAAEHLGVPPRAAIMISTEARAHAAKDDGEEEFREFHAALPGVPMISGVFAASLFPEQASLRTDAGDAAILLLG